MSLDTEQEVKAN